MDGASNYPTAGLASTDSDVRMIDDLLRRELRVSNPNDPDEVASALRKKYKDEALKLDEEAAGFSVGSDFPSFGAASAGGDSTQSVADTEFGRIAGELDADLRELTTAPATRPWWPELSGWQTSVSRELADGSANARLAQDPARRDRALLSAKQLGSMARVARLVATLSPDAMDVFRRVARSIDGASFGLRMLVGQALYGAGLGASGTLLKSPSADIRGQRDALVGSLRRLTGTSDGTDRWGLDASVLGGLLQQAERRGSPELRAYLREETLTSTLDDLVSLASRQDPQALRRLSGSAAFSLRSLRNLQALIAEVSPSAPSPALSSFWQQLELFLNSFERQDYGRRYVEFFLPGSLSALGLGVDCNGRKTLRTLLELRGDYMCEADTFVARCKLSRLAGAEVQVRVDLGLTFIDRAIDAFALASAKDADLPKRAHAFVLPLHVIAAHEGVPKSIHETSKSICRLLESYEPGDELESEVKRELVSDEQSWADLARNFVRQCCLDDPGRLTDVGTALLLDCGPVDRPSFVPPRPMRLSIDKIATIQEKARGDLP